MKNTSLWVSILIGIALFSCSKEDDWRIDENYNPVINPDNFVDSVTHPYFPLTAGIKYNFSAPTSDGIETVLVTILPEKKVILGINCTVVRDVVRENGEIIEDTYDWYAQDKNGNVWYFGEDVSNFENGKIHDKSGSFEAGVNGAKPGIIMLASPVLELPYRQEYYFGNAEDWAKVVETGLTVTVTYGTFENCIKTEDWNALEPDAPVEYKYYAPGIGIIREEVAGTEQISQLISIE